MSSTRYGRRQPTSYTDQATAQQTNAQNATRSGWSVNASMTRRVGAYTAMTASNPFCRSTVLLLTPYAAMTGCGARYSGGISSSGSAPAPGCAAAPAPAGIASCILW